MLDILRNRVHFKFQFRRFVEIHLDVVLEVLLMVGLDFLFYQTCRWLSQIDSLKILGWLINKWRRYLTFQQLKKKKTSSRSLSYKKYPKTKLPEGSIYTYSLAQFWENCKKNVKIEVTGHKIGFFFNVFRWINQMRRFSVPVIHFILNLLAVFSTMRQTISTLPVILSFVNFSCIPNF